MVESRGNGSDPARPARREGAALRWLTTGGAGLSLVLIVVPVFGYDPPTHTDTPMSAVGLLADGQSSGVGLVFTLALWVGLAAWLWWRRAGLGWAALAVLSLVSALGLVEAMSSYAVTWHGLDAQGREIVDVVTADSGVGTVVITLSMAAFAVAACVVPCRLVGSLLRRAIAAQPDPETPFPPPRETRLIRWLATGGAAFSLALLFVPVFEYDSPNEFDAPMTVVGLLTDGRPAGIFLLLAMALWPCLAVWAWWRRPGFGWVALALLSLVAAATATYGASSYNVIWDGIDAQGRPTGGLVRATPGVGTVAVFASMAAFAVATAVAAWWAGVAWGKSRERRSGG